MIVGGSSGSIKMHQKKLRSQMATTFHSTPSENSSSSGIDYYLLVRCWYPDCGTIIVLLGVGALIVLWPKLDITSLTVWVQFMQKE